MKMKIEDAAPEHAMAPLEPHRCLHRLPLLVVPWVEEELGEGEPEEWGFRGA